MSMVESIRIDCPCGHPNCPGYGSPRAKAWRNGELHIKRCPCARCSAGRVKSRARTRENKIAAQLGGTRSYASGSLSGYDVHTEAVEIEETSNQSIVRGAKRWWLSKAVQTKLSRLMSRSLRPRCLVLSWGENQVTPKLAVMPYQDFVTLCGLAQMDRRGISPEKLRQTLEQLIKEAS